MSTIAPARSDESVRLALRADPRDPADEDVVVSAYLPWATSIARRYGRRGVEVDDLEQVAALALLKALRRFDSSRGSFEAFAGTTINGEIKRFFRDSAWTVRPTRRIQELRPRVEEARRDLEQRTGTATQSQIADVLELSRCDVGETLAAGELFRPPSMDEDDRGEARHERVGATDAGLTSVEDWSVLGDACRCLGERDRRVLYLRFVRDLSQSEIGGQLGLSQMQVSRDLRRILDLLHTAIKIPA